jgi:nucleoside-diphosphate-sugar epimerase
MNKSNLILAGSGYLGESIIAEYKIIKDTFNIIELCRSIKTDKPGVKSIQIDFDNITDDMKYIEGSVVVYMAPPDTESLKDTRLNKFLNKISYYRIKKLIYISTSGVYGNCNGQIVNEENQINPLTDRAKRRANAESQIKSYCKRNNIGGIIFRVPGIYGRNRLPIKRVMDRDPLIKIEESRTTNLIHVSDLTRLVIKAFELSNKETEIINVSDGKAIKTTKYYEIIYKALNIKLPEYISYEQAMSMYDEKRASFLKESRVLDITKMKELFPDCIKYEKLEDGIEKSL